MERDPALERGEMYHFGWAGLPAALQLLGRLLCCCGGHSRCIC